jgi:hypothetical protein
MNVLVQFPKECDFVYLFIFGMPSYCLPDIARMIPDLY